MRAGVTPGPTRTPTSPPAYVKHQGSAGLRLSPTCTLFILWQVLYVNHSILLTQIIRKRPPLLATLCSRTCRLSRPCPGNDDHLMLYFVFTYTFVLNLSVFSVPRQSSPKEQRRPGQPECRTCLSRRRRLKSRQLPPPPKPPFPWTRRLKPLPRPPRQRPKRQLIRRPPAQPHRLTTRT